MTDICIFSYTYNTHIPFINSVFYIMQTFPTYNEQIFNFSDSEPTGVEILALY